jgi:acyl-CoA synthetase (AMP-forming)/AMP-acid ligase II
VELLSQRACDEPGAALYTLMRAGSPQASWSVGDVDLRARAIGALLQREARPGERALLLYPTGLDFGAALFGCLYAGVVAVPGPPPIPDRSLAEIARLAQEVGVSWVLSTCRIPAELTDTLSITPALRGARWLATDAVELDRADGWREGSARDADPAIAIATPFMPGTPGVLWLSHGELFDRVAEIQHHLGGARVDRSVTWLPPYIDMGLVAGVLHPLRARQHVALMSSLEFLRSPVLWLETIDRFGARASWGTEFAYALARAAFERSRGELDLSRWDVALVDTPGPTPALDRFARALEPSGFRDESFVYSGAASGGGAATWLGRHAEPGYREAVLIDPRTTRPPPDRDTPGELWLRARSIGEGYWEGRRRPARAWPAYRGDTGEGPFLATGDAGTLVDRDLAIHGPARDVIRLRDGSVEPEGMEAFLEGSHPSLGADAIVAFGVGTDGDESLVVAAEVAAGAWGSPGESEAWRTGIASIQERVEEYCGARAETVVLLRPGALGAADDPAARRARCRTRYLEGTLTPVGPI